MSESPSSSPSASVSSSPSASASASPTAAALLFDTMTMTLTADAEVQEKSTLVITATFTDEDGNSVAPNPYLFWSLTDLEGNIINGRDSVYVAVSETIKIVLRGNDLALSADKDEYRLVTVEGTYDSALGDNLPIKKSIKFLVKNLVKVL